MTKAADQLITPEFRLAFPSVFEPSSFQGSKEKYRIVMLFDKDAKVEADTNIYATLDFKGETESVINMFKRFAKKAVEDTWPNKNSRPSVSKDKLPYHDADEEDKIYAGYPGCWYIPASTMYKPKVVAQDGRTPIESEDILYAGCYARAIITAYTYNKGSAGVAFGLQGIQKTRDGEKLANGGLADDAFDSVGEVENMLNDEFMQDKPTRNTEDLFE